MKAKTNLKFGALNDTTNISTINSNGTSNVAQVNQVTQGGTSAVTVANMPGVLAYASSQVIWAGLIVEPLLLRQF
jgi:hypothetical protein